MEFMNTPMNDYSNKNENLIQTEQKKQQNVNITPFPKEKNGSFSGETFIIEFIYKPIIIIGFIILIIFIILAILIELDIYGKILMPLSGFILLLIIMLIFPKKIVLEKDILNKKIILKRINYLCFTTMKLYFDLENTHFFVDSKLEISEESPSLSYKLIIIKDYLLDNSLNESNIKQKPVKYIYSFNNIAVIYRIENFNKLLNNFVGSSRDYKNPLLFDINIYLKDTKIQLNYWQKGKYMKISDYFFTYYLKSFKYGCCDKPTYGLISILVALISDAFLFGILMVIISVNYKINNFFIVFIIVMAIIFVFDLFIYIIYKFLKFKNENILRIDFIYSKDFERIFIGLVQYTQTKYVNTFEFQKNNISKFFYKKEENNGVTYFNLKVEFKNNETQQICTLMKQSQDELEGLISFLNGEFIVHTNHSLNSYEQI